MQFQQHGSYCNENIPNPVNLLSIDQQNLFSVIISGQLERVCCVSVNPIHWIQDRWIQYSESPKTGVSRRYSKNLKRLPSSWIWVKVFSIGHSQLRETCIARFWVLIGCVWALCTDLLTRVKLVPANGTSFGATTVGDHRVLTGCNYVIVVFSKLSFALWVLILPVCSSWQFF